MKTTSETDVTLNIALLEDDSEHANVIQNCAREHSYKCDVYRNTEQFKEGFLQKDYSAALIDMYLGEFECGLDMVKWMRGTCSSDTPVLLISGCNHSVIASVALKEGADDFLAKPIESSELAARLDALTGRNRSQSVAPVQIHLPYILNSYDQTIHFNEARIEMEETEFDVAIYLFSHQDRIINRKELQIAIWGDSDCDSITIDACVNRLRKKLQLVGSSNWTLSTVYQQGYRLTKKSAHSITNVA